MHAKDRIHFPIQDIEDKNQNAAIRVDKDRSRLWNLRMQTICTQYENFETQTLDGLCIEAIFSSLFHLQFRAFSAAHASVVTVIGLTKLLNVQNPSLAFIIGLFYNTQMCVCVHSSNWLLRTKGLHSNTLLAKVSRLWNLLTEANLQRTSLEELDAALTARNDSKLCGENVWVLFCKLCSCVQSQTNSTIFQILVRSHAIFIRF